LLIPARWKTMTNMKYSFLFYSIVAFGLLTSASSSSWACGCTYDPQGKTSQYPNNLFESKWREPHEVATLRWKGKAYNLKLVSKKEPKNLKPGSISIHEYTGVTTPIQVNVTATEGKPTCKGSECESTPYTAKITITLDGLSEIVAASGDCGC
jgi:hypothetical protein